MSACRIACGQRARGASVCLRRPRHRQPAFTLAELVLAMLLATTVTLAVGHVVVQITTGVANVDRRSQAQTEAAIALVRMRSELQYATIITSLSPAQITFKHPDVDGDGAVDVITYEWSGVPGDPITREINSTGKQNILENCRSFTLSATPPPIRLTAGTRYPIKLEYYENSGVASCSLSWSGPGISTQVIPSTVLYPAFTDASVAIFPASGTGLTGQYHDNMDFTSLKLTRTDAAINMNWGSTAPVSGMGSDTYSVRWTGQIEPAATGDYTFYVTADDGVRLWINDCLVINNWTDHTATENSASSFGLPRIDLHIEAGPQGNSIQLDGAVRLLNQPVLGS